MCSAIVCTVVIAVMYVCVLCTVDYCPCCIYLMIIITHIGNHLVGS
jgi:hypothetical protein